MTLHRRRSQRSNLAGLHILVVDDDEDARETLRLVLEYCGATVWVADSPKVAVKLLEAIRPSAILTDIAMPEHDGYWLLEQARKRWPGIIVPVVAITGVPEDHGREAVLAKGFDAYLTKPFNPTSLCRLMQAAVGLSASRTGLPARQTLRAGGNGPSWGAS